MVGGVRWVKKQARKKQGKKIQMQQHVSVWIKAVVWNDSEHKAHSETIETRSLKC